MAALAWLTHPVTCVALVLLIVNDHVLKAMWGTWWTGKLSDAAWLVVGPPLLATIMVGACSFVGVRRPSARSCTRVSLAVVGALTFLAAVLVVASADLLRGGRAAWLIVVTGVDVALVVELVPRPALAAVVAVAVLGAGVAAQRLMTHAPQADG